MRFILAVVLVVMNAFAMLATSKGFPSQSAMVGILLGGAVLFPATVAALFSIPKRHRNNKRFFRIFNVVSCLLLLSAIPKILDLYGKPPKALVGQHNLIEMTVPNSWRQGDQTNEHLSFSLLNQSGTSSLVVSATEFETNSQTIEQHANETAQRLESNPAFGSKSDLKRCQAAEFDCVYREIVLSFGDDGTKMLLATLESKQRAYLYDFIATTNAPSYDDRKPQFLEILQSVKER